MTSTEYQQLVEYLGRQFAAVDDRFVAIDSRFAGLERRMDSLEEGVSAGFRDVLGHFDEIYRRLERLEQEYYAVTQARIEGIEERLRR